MSYFQVLCVIFSASSAQRSPKRFQVKLRTTAKPEQNDKKFGSNLKDYEDYEDYYDYYDYYYDEDPLPSGPTRRPAPAAKSLKPLGFPGKKTNIITRAIQSKHNHQLSILIIIWSTIE